MTLPMQHIFLKHKTHILRALRWSVEQRWGLISSQMTREENDQVFKHTQHLQGMGTKYLDWILDHYNQAMNILEEVEHRLEG